METTQDCCINQKVSFIDPPPAEREGRQLGRAGAGPRPSGGEAGGWAKAAPGLSGALPSQETVLAGWVLGGEAVGEKS